MKICPICQNKESMIWYKDLNVCLNCTHIYKNQDVNSLCYENYRSSAHTMHSEEHVTNAKITADYRIKFINAFKPMGSILELGCGHRYFLDSAINKGYSIEGTELSKAMIEDLREFKIHYGNPSEIENLGKFDIICGFHVLEHLNNPLNELKILKTHLNPDGIMVFEVPSMVFYGLNVDHKDYYEPAHTQYFNQLSIIELAKSLEMTPIAQFNWETGKTAYTIIALSLKTDKEKSMWDSIGYMRRFKSI